MVRNAFIDLFENIVCLYPDYTKYTFNCVGSIACIFRDTLTQVAVKFNMKVGKIIKDPMEGLVEYYSNK